MNRAQRIYAASLIWSIAGLLAALAFGLDRGTSQGHATRRAPAPPSFELPHTVDRS